jgi:hypothetical protein
VRDFDLYIATCGGRNYRRNNPVKMEFDVWPLLIDRHDNGNSAARKILLVPNVLVGRQQQFVAGFLGLAQQIAVLECVPADLASERNLMPDKTAGDRIQSAVVEMNPHP